MCLTLCKFPAGALIHIAHRAAQSIALIVDRHEALHLRAEGYPLDLLRVDSRFFDETARAFSHGLPPFVGVLLRAAVGQDVQAVALVLARQQLERFAQLEKAGLNARRSDVIRDNKHFSLPTFSLLNFYLPIFSAFFAKRMKYSVIFSVSSAISPPQKIFIRSA